MENTIIVKCWDIGESKESCNIDIMEYGMTLLKENKIYKCIDWIQQLLSIKYTIEDPSSISFNHDLLPQLTSIVENNKMKESA
jgi:hypothetical protein